MLENINPELHEIQLILNRIATHYGLTTLTPNTKTPENLLQILEHVEECEKKATNFMLHINKAYEPPKKQPSIAIAPNEKFEKVTISSPPHFTLW